LNRILPEGFKRVEVVCLGGAVTVDDPILVFFGKESRAVKHLDANVKGVLVGDLIEDAYECSITEKYARRVLQTPSRGVPVGGHCPPIGLLVFC